MIINAGWRLMRLTPSRFASLGVSHFESEGFKMRQFETIFGIVDCSLYLFLLNLANLPR